MIFEKYLIPDRMFDRFEDITPEYLSDLGIKYVFSDIDNTLATYEDEVPPENVKKWLGMLAEKGILISFVSNNSENRVDRFNKDLGYVTRAEAGKPKIKKLTEAMDEVGASPERSLLLGDQLLTDAAAGKRAHMRVFIVKPIRDKKTLFFRFKRMLEKPYIRKYNRKHAKCEQK